MIRRLTFAPINLKFQVPSHSPHPCFKCISLEFVYTRITAIAKVGEKLGTSTFAIVHVSFSKNLKNPLQSRKQRDNSLTEKRLSQALSIQNT